MSRGDTASAPPGNARLEYVLVGVFALGYCLTRIPPGILVPFDTAWTEAGDWAATYNGWLLYVRGPWTLPPGATPALLHPHGSSVFYTNSVFWLCLVGKLLAPLFKEPFQLYGLYLASSYLGLGVVALWLFRALGLGVAPRVLGAAVATMDPVVNARFGHLALTAQWVLLAQVALGLVLAWRTPRAARLAWASALLAAFAVGLEGYLAAMAIPLSVAVLALARLRHRLPWRHLAGALATLGLGTLFMLWATGAITGGAVNRAAGGFGHYCADLTTFFNTNGMSRFIPPTGTSSMQGEGFGYLGLGVLLLLGPAAWHAVRARGAVARAALAAWPLLLVCLLEAWYAVSARVNFGGRLLFEWWGPFRLLGPLPDLFRTSGRFIWPLHQVLVVAAVLGAAAAAKRPRVAVGLLLAGALIQGVEVRGRPHIFVPRGQPRSTAPFRGLGAEHRHLVLLPMHVLYVCDYNEELVTRLTRIAASERLTFNSGGVGRVPEGVTAEACKARVTRVDPDTVYVVAPDSLDDFKDQGQCGVVDDVWVCVSSARETALRERLEAAEQHRP